MALNAGDLDRNALAAVKAVSEGYPLRGMLRLSAEPGGAETPARADPSRGYCLGRRTTAAGDRCPSR